MRRVEEGDPIIDDRGAAVAFGTVMFGLTGIVFGTVIGAIKGRTDVYSVYER